MVEVSGYKVHERIGSGGVGDVYRATQISTGATVAVKLVREITDDAGMWRRVERELRALVELVGHANVVGVVEMVPTSGGRALVMEYAPGGSLADRVEQGGPLSVEEIVLVGRQVASAVAAAHERGIVHRDIKPQNVLIDGYGQAKLCDFGIASLLRSAELRDRTSAISMRYASPEDVEEEGDLIGPPSDVYSLGATLLFLRRGAPPTTLERVAGWVPASDSTDPTTAELDGIIAELLAVNPYTRPTMRAALERLTTLDRQLEHPVDAVFTDESELFPATTELDPEVLFPQPSLDPAARRADLAPPSSFDAPSMPVSPRKQKPGSRAIETVPAAHQRPVQRPAPDVPTIERSGATEVIGKPTEAALTRAFGPLNEPSWAPTRSDEMNRFWNDDTVDRADPPRPERRSSYQPETPRRRWPWLLALVVGVGAAAGFFLWRRGGDSPAAEPSTTTLVSTSVVATTTATSDASTVPTTAVAATTTETSAPAPTTAPPTTALPTTAPTTVAPVTTQPGTVPVAARPVGLVELSNIERPDVAVGTCLVQVEQTLAEIDCDQPHDLELLASVQAEDTGAIAVNDAVIRQTGGLLCANRFIELVHNSNSQSALQTAITLEATTPDVAGWESGDRNVECWVLVPDQRLIGSAVGKGW